MLVNVDLSDCSVLSLRLMTGVYLNGLPSRYVTNDMYVLSRDSNRIYSYEEVKRQIPHDYIITPYCVSDNLRQVVNYFQRFLDEPDRNFAISLHPEYRDKQPPENGWRWEKNGVYIGNKTPQADYLHDEPEIKHVINCMLYLVDDKYVVDDRMTVADIEKEIDDFDNAIATLLREVR